MIIFNPVIAKGEYRTERTLRASWWLVDVPMHGVVGIGNPVMLEPRTVRAGLLSFPQRPLIVAFVLRHVYLPTCRRAASLEKYGHRSASLPFRRRRNVSPRPRSQRRIVADLSFKRITRLVAGIPRVLVRALILRRPSARCWRSKLPANGLALCPRSRNAEYGNPRLIC